MLNCDKIVAVGNNLDDPAQGIMKIKEILKFNGHIYEWDGKKMWKDGKLMPGKNITSAKSMEQITAIKIDDSIFHDGKMYYPQSTS